MQKGEIVDRYRLEERLGAGTFGEVWRANQLADGEDVGVACAIKVMKLVRARGEASASGWLDEVRNLVRVAGETIPRILEANVWNDHAYIAMELLDGTTLGARLAHGPVPWRRALFVADRIAQAFAAAHAVGVVHRDVKPGNVVLAGDRVCVIDWGIASLDAPRGAPPEVARRGGDVGGAGEEITTDGEVAPIAAQRAAPIGTPGYMAPEVYDGAAPAPAQDVFALGVVLYEMIAGRLPQQVERPESGQKRAELVKAYRGALDRATMDGALTPLRERCPDVPAGVAELVDALLARDPECRPADVRAAIERASRFPHGIPDPPYAGLVKLGAERAGLYYGQADSVRVVLERLRAQRAAVLWGPSGSGKSSLAHAGVAATMDRTLFGGTDGWTIHVVRPRERVLRVVGESAPSAVRVGQLGHVVVIDQLEEVVDLAASDQDAFCAAALALLDRTAAVAVRDAALGPSDEVRIVATIRDDLEWRVDREVPALRPLLERRVIVKGVDANFARSIIEEPARALGYAIEGLDAVSREVEERLSADPAKLPVVQYALSEWWERRDRERKVLPAAAWRELGGVDGALSTVAERLYTSLAPDAQQRLRGLFVRLFVGERKQPVPEASLSAAERAAMDELVRLRLVGRRERRGTSPFYEVEHESLARNWGRLTAWLAEARDDRLLADELERDAAAYGRDRDGERLWKKGRLATAVEMAARDRVSLSAGARGFLEQATRHSRRSRYVRAVAGGLGVALVLGVVYILVLNAAVSTERDRAMDDKRAAETDRESARSELIAATARLDEAARKLAEAETQRAAAQRARDEADVQRTQLAQAVSRAEAAQLAATKAAEEAVAAKKAADAEHTRAEAEIKRRVQERVQEVCGTSLRP